MYLHQAHKYNIRLPYRLFGVYVGCVRVYLLAAFRQQVEFLGSFVELPFAYTYKYVSVHTFFVAMTHTKFNNSENENIISRRLPCQRIKLALYTHFYICIIFFFMPEEFWLTPLPLSHFALSNTHNSTCGSSSKRLWIHSATSTYNNCLKLRKAFERTSYIYFSLMMCNNLHTNELCEYMLLTH